VDTTGIKDDIVVGVIRQLEKTGNRPHTSKELAAVLANSVPTIDAYVSVDSGDATNDQVTNISFRSTNPNALIQARLASYLKGPWPIVSPCPLGKQQENIHPRRVFYYLTTQPHQPIPEVSAMVPIARRVISPAASSHTDDDAEDKYIRDRSRLSPSPEIILSSPELEDDSDIDVASVFSGRSSLSRDLSSSNLSHNRRAQSPPLEREERDFKQTANELQEQRRNSRQRTGSAPNDNAIKMEENSGSDVRNTIEVSDDNDGSSRPHKEPLPSLFPNSDALAFNFSSPVLRPQYAPMHLDGKVLQPYNDEGRQVFKGVDSISLDIVNNDPMDISSAWDENGQLRSPEDIELDELQGVFDGYY